MARTVALLALFALFHVTMSITVQEFFKDADIKSNLTKIKWAHAVNSKDDLRKNLNLSTIHMLEADVNMGRTTGMTNETKIPIMAHDANGTSDLSLQEFLNEVLKNKTKGVKLDFKSDEAFQEGLKVILGTTNVTAIPVWLNADILKGPVNADAVPLDPKKFFDGAKKFNGSLLSVGWTTKLGNLKPGENVTSDKYQKSQVEEMVKLVREHGANASVTYPVRAVFAANDVALIQSLLSNSSANNPTLTIWSHPNDKVNVTGLNELIKSVGLAKIYIDVPEELSSKLDLNGAFSLKSSLAVMMTSLLAVFAVKLL